MWDFRSMGAGELTAYLTAAALVIDRIVTWHLARSQAKQRREEHAAGVERQDAADARQDKAEARQDDTDAFDRMKELTDNLWKWNQRQESKIGVLEAEASAKQARLAEIARKQEECERKHSDCEEKQAEMEAQLSRLNHDVSKIKKDNGDHS